MSKHLHAGRAAEAGVTAATLAAHGISGPPQILEGRRGFFAAMCPDASPDLLSSGPGDPWQLHATSLKPWPSCRHTHPAIDAALELHNQMVEMDIAPEAIAGIDIGAYSAALDLCDRREPDSAYGAKFSLQHCVAAALALGDVWFDAFDGPARERFAALRGLANLSRDKKLDAVYPSSWGGTVTLMLKDGEEIRAERIHARGDPEMPLTSDEIRSKAAKLLEWGGVHDPLPFIDAVLATAEGGDLPPLPLMLDKDGVKSAKAVD